MRDDLLKEQLMSYARTAADEAVQPDAAAIHRRARRHYRRLAALTVTAVSLSPDGRSVAVPVGRALDAIGVRVLDVARTDAFDKGRLVRSPDPGCTLVAADFQPRTGRLAAFEGCRSNGLLVGSPSRCRLVYLDLAGGDLRSRSFSFDSTGGDLHVSTMDFDASGRHWSTW